MLACLILQKKGAKMNSRFSVIGQRRVGYGLKRTKETAYYSPYNGCNVVPFRCEKCALWYEEEKEAALAKIRRGEQLVCIRCDSDAEEVSVTAVRVEWAMVGV